MIMIHRLIKLLLLVASIMALGHAYAETLPDPTRPANYSTQQASRKELPAQLIDWDVRAIKSSASGRNAVVNGKLVKVGDAIDKATIVDITPDTVVLTYDRKQLVLRLMPESIKKKPTESVERIRN